MAGKRRAMLGVTLAVLATLCVVTGSYAERSGQGGADDPCGPAPDCSECMTRDVAAQIKCINACNQEILKWNQCVAEHYRHEQETSAAATIAAWRLSAPTPSLPGGVPLATPGVPGPLPTYPAQPETPPAPPQAPPVDWRLEEALVIGSTGSVRVLRQGVEVALEQGASIQAGDEIVTGPDGQLDIVLLTGDEIEIGGATRLRLEELDLGQVEVRLDLGTIINRARALPGRQFRVHTPVFVIGVRGTEFEVATDGKTMTVRVLEGEVEVWDLEGQVIATMGPGEARTFAAGGRGALAPALIGGGVALLALAGLGAWLAVRRRGRPGGPATEAGASSASA